jgi:hypothetical protein
MARHPVQPHHHGTRIGSDLTSLEFAADVTAPTAQRYFVWDAGNKNLTTNATNAALVGGAIGTGDYPMWELYVQLKAYAKDTYMRGVKEAGGEETYHCFLSPQAMSKLKLDANYLLNLRHAQPRGDSNSLFTGSTVKIDGIYFHEHRHVPNTRTAPNGSKWGGGAVDGCRMLFCGAQALGMADIGAPEWEEKEFDYGNQQGISVGKICGFLKPKFSNIYEAGAVEDFGVISCYAAQ